MDCHVTATSYCQMGIIIVPGRSINLIFTVNINLISTVSINLISMACHLHGNLKFHQNNNNLKSFCFVVLNVEEKFDEMWNEWMIRLVKTRSKKGACVKLMTVGKIKILSVDNDDRSGVHATEQWRCWTTFNMPFFLKHRHCHRHPFVLTLYS